MKRRKIVDFIAYEPYVLCTCVGGESLLKSTSLDWTEIVLHGKWLQDGVDKSGCIFKGKIISKLMRNHIIGQKLVYFVSNH